MCILSRVVADNALPSDFHLSWDRTWTKSSVHVTSPPSLPFIMGTFCSLRLMTLSSARAGNHAL
jgi:hypothetical protein